MNSNGFGPLDYQDIERRASELRAQAMKDGARWLAALIRSGIAHLLFLLHQPNRVR